MLPTVAAATDHCIAINGKSLHYSPTNPLRIA
jgi:hypothetical protein